MDDKAEAEPKTALDKYYWWFYVSTATHDKLTQRNDVNGFYYRSVVYV